MTSKITTLIAWLIIIVSLPFFMGSLGFLTLSLVTDIDIGTPQSRSSSIEIWTLIGYWAVKYMFFFFTLLSLLFLIGAIGLLKRRNWGRKLVVTLASLLIISLIVMYLLSIWAVLLVEEQSGSSATAVSTFDLVLDAGRVFLTCCVFYLSIWHLRRTAVRSEFEIEGASIIQVTSSDSDKTDT